MLCVPGVIGAPRPKGLIIEYETLSDFGIRAYSKADYLTDGQKREIKHNHRLLLKLRLPVYSRPDLKIIGGLEYFEEQYDFEYPSTLEHPMYQTLHNRDLRSVGLRLYLSKLYHGNKFFFARFASNLNGDFSAKGVPIHKFLKVSVSALYGWKKNPYTSFAIGLGATYSFGRPMAFPLFSYSHSWINGFGLDLVLPTKVELRYTASPSTIFYLTSELNGASYRLRLPSDTFREVETFELRNGEVRNLLRLEREIYDFLWLGLESGMRSNISFNLSERNTLGRRDEVINTDLNHAFFFNVSIFLVPPRKWTDKKK